MAYEELVPVPAGETWVLISQSGTAITVATWSNKGHSTAIIKAMASETPPTDRKGSHDYVPGAGEASRTLAELWPGITPAYLYALSPAGNTQMSCSHA